MNKRILMNAVCLLTILAVIAATVQMMRHYAPAHADDAPLSNIVADRTMETVGIEMTGRGAISKFIEFKLTDGADSMLHGYVPHEGDTVEWYVRGVDCAEPAVKCNFELAIRKK